MHKNIDLLCVVFVEDEMSKLMPTITITLIKTKETEEYLAKKIPEYIEMESKLSEEELGKYIDEMIIELGKTCEYDCKPKWIRIPESILVRNSK